jgi:hypothetical protein
MAGATLMSSIPMATSLHSVWDHPTQRIDVGFTPDKDVRRAAARADFSPMPHGLERELSACPRKYWQTFQSLLSTGEAHCARN